MLPSITIGMCMSCMLSPILPCPDTMHRLVQKQCNELIIAHCPLLPANLWHDNRLPCMHCTAIAQSMLEVHTLSHCVARTTGLCHLRYTCWSCRVQQSSNLHLSPAALAPGAPLKKLACWHAQLLLPAGPCQPQPSLASEQQLLPWLQPTLQLQRWTCQQCRHVCNMQWHSALQPDLVAAQPSACS